LLKLNDDDNDDDDILNRLRLTLTVFLGVGGSLRNV